MKVFYRNIYIETSFNNTSVPLKKCILCRKVNISHRRIDVISVFGDEESFCIRCWINKVWYKSR